MEGGKCALGTRHVYISLLVSYDMRKAN
jgi:hypothetical protein